MSASVICLFIVRKEDSYEHVSPSPPVFTMVDTIVNGGKTETHLITGKHVGHINHRYPGRRPTYQCPLALD